MAQTKIWAKKSDIGESVRYVLNPEKIKTKIQKLYSDEITYITDKHIADGEIESVFLTAAWNCTETNAAEKMMLTKELWNHGDDGKNDRILVYHMDQSFKPGEVTPELAYKIGCAFVDKVFAERYEVIMGTHIDKAHIHNHFLINAVSYVDGKRLRSESTGIRSFYFAQIRKISDELCRENNLSVIGETTPRKFYRDRTGHYTTWNEFDKKKEATKRDRIREDFDSLLPLSISFPDFLSQLKRMGYSIKVGNVKHMAVKKNRTDRYVRVRSLGFGYDEETLRDRIEHPELYDRIPSHIDGQSFWTNRISATSYRYTKTGHMSYRDMRKSGLVRTYYQYLYLLGRRPTDVRSFRKYDQLRQYRKISNHFKYLLSNNIQSRSQLDARLEDLHEKMRGAMFQRNALYRELNKPENQSPEDQKYFGERKEDANRCVKVLRREIRICNEIGGYEEKVPEKIQKFQNQKKATEAKDKKERNKQL